jgi:hypothetical protein
VVIRYQSTEAVVLSETTELLVKDAMQALGLRIRLTVERSL